MPIHTPSVVVVTLLTGITVILLVALLKLCLALITHCVPGLYTKIVATSNNGDFLTVLVEERRLWRWRKETSRRGEADETGALVNDAARPASLGDLHDGFSTEPKFHEAGHALFGRKVGKLERVLVVLVAVLLALAVFFFSWIVGYATKLDTVSYKSVMTGSAVKAVIGNTSTIFTSPSVKSVQYDAASVSSTAWTQASDGFLLYQTNSTKSTSGNSTTYSCGYIEDIYYATLQSHSLPLEVALSGGNFKRFKLVCTSSGQSNLFRVASVGSSATSKDNLIGTSNSVLSMKNGTSVLTFVYNDGDVMPKMAVDVTFSTEYLDITKSEYKEYLSKVSSIDSSTKSMNIIVLPSGLSSDSSTVTHATSYEQLVQKGLVSQEIDYVLVKEQQADEYIVRTLAWCVYKSNTCYNSTMTYTMLEEQSFTWDSNTLESNLIESSLSANGSTVTLTTANTPIAFSSVYYGTTNDVNTVLASMRRNVDNTGPQLKVCQTRIRTEFKITALVGLLVASLGTYVLAKVILIYFPLWRHASQYHLYSELAKDKCTASVLSINKDVDGGVFTPIGQEIQHFGASAMDKVTRKLNTQKSFCKQ
ncbi:uncharacterized protein V1518DRAFT_413394 [Limtongia smithiae]|uniref:uncharacterized protein n=1 Tax=Limtongia smithiae TaxID=1125753 RepID=UPI0034CEC877